MIATVHKNGSAELSAHRLQSRPWSTADCFENLEWQLRPHPCGSCKTHSSECWTTILVSPSASERHFCVEVRQALWSHAQLALSYFVPREEEYDWVDRPIGGHVPLYCSQFIVSIYSVNSNQCLQVWIAPRGCRWPGRRHLYSSYWTQVSCR